MKITLPKPVSVNMMYHHNGHHTYISQKGKDWIEEAGWLLKSQCGGITFGIRDLSFHIKLYICGRGDIDNYNKCLFDLFTKMGIIKDDSQIMSLHVEKIKVPHRTGEKVEVKIEIY